MMGMRMLDDLADRTPEEIGQYVIDRYRADAPKPPEGLSVSRPIGLLHFEAFAFLMLGPDGYQRLGESTVSLTDRELDQVQSGCAQIVDWRGVSLDRPLDGLGIHGFNILLAVLFFTLDMQRAIPVDGQSGVFIDEMRMRHMVNTDEIVTLYNLVDHRKPAPIPCPYCGAQLRTATAKQCRSCGMDWHDPKNVINRKAASPSS